MNSGNSWNERTGFGPTNLETMLSTDPSQFPDENPLPDKKKLGKDTEGSTGFGSSEGGSVPLPQEVADYADGIKLPLSLQDEDPNYVYRGLDDSRLPRAATIFRLQSTWAQARASTRKRSRRLVI